jgi:CheY-like chemotaxis protein
MVEDEFLVGMMAKKLLESLGAVVIGPYARLTDGIAAAKAERFDGALLDFNLAGELAEPLADFLIAHGVPFIFLTGYQREILPERFRDRPLVRKPCPAKRLVASLSELLRPAAEIGVSC